MYFSKDGKEISAAIKEHNKKIIRVLAHMHLMSLLTTTNEVAYFRSFFPNMASYFNSLTLPGVRFSCRAKEIHQSPYVKPAVGPSCELGDYFIIVKYMKGSTLVGRKKIIFQLKRSYNNSWSISQPQLSLLRDWPTFSFGRTFKGTSSFNLRPTRPEYGSFVLVRKKTGLINRKNFNISNLFGTAFDISRIQQRKRISVNDEDRFYYSGVCAYFNLLTWEIGEPIIGNTDISDFTSALYRYMEWEEDPPEEFKGFQKEGEEKAFWGIEITVSTDQDEVRKM